MPDGFELDPSAAVQMRRLLMLMRPELMRIAMRKAQAEPSQALVFLGKMQGLDDLDKYLSDCSSKGKDKNATK